jgi:hypothetical protein
MADPFPGRPYQIRLEAAEKLFDDNDDLEQCIAEAKKNLS